MQVVALVSDLMFRSKLETALRPLGDVSFTREPADAAGADAVVIDLGTHGAHVAAVRQAAPNARIVGFGSHVEKDVLERARSDGADEVLPRSKFFADPGAALGGPASG